MEPDNDATNQGNTRPFAFDGPYTHQVTTTQDIIRTLSSIVTPPPLRDYDVKIEVPPDHQIKRNKRKSKFTKEQDEMIVDMKKKGMSWQVIAETTGVGSFLTARNRYQVLMGQQGVASTIWSAEDVRSLQSVVDEGELEKWRFISRELYKLTGKFFTDVQCRELVRDLFMESPEEFGVTEETVKESLDELSRETGT